MSRGTAADNSLTPVELEEVFRTAARIKESELQSRHENLSVQLAFFVFFLGYLGFRLGTLLHFDEDNVMRDEDGTIVGIEVPNHDACDRGDDGGICAYCKKLAGAMARNAEDEDVTPEDFYDKYWSPKSEAGNREIPIRLERGRKIIERFLEVEGRVDVSEETVRRRLTRLAEVAEGIDPDQMMPQALRASAANYWINFEDIGIEKLRYMMGWKYLTTAKFYIDTGFQQLYHAKGEALNKDSDTPFDVDLRPPAYEDIRSTSELIPLERVSPDTELMQHEYAHTPSPLEKEAQEHQTTVDSFSSAAKAVLEPFTPLLRDRLKHEYQWLEASPAATASPEPKRVAKAGGGLFLTAAFSGTLFAYNGFLENVLAGQPMAVASLLSAVVIAIPLMIWDLHEIHHEAPQQVEPETLFDRVIVATHARVDSLVTRYCSVRERALSLPEKCCVE